MRERTLSWLILCSLVFPLSLHAPEARADGGATSEAADPAARRAFEEGLSAYERGRFKDAIASFEYAYQISHHPKLLFNIARAADGDAQYDKAISAYEAYLAALPAADNREFVQSRIAKMRELRAAPSATGASPPAKTPLPDVTAESHADSAAASSAGQAPASARRDEREGSAKPVWKRGWFWGIVGAVAVGGVAAALAARPSEPSRARTDEYYFTGGP